MTDYNMPLRRSGGMYSAQSLSAIPQYMPTSPTRYPNYYNNSPYGSNRYLSTGYTSPYRAPAVDHEIYRPDNSRYYSNSNTRAYSYDDLHNPNRYQPSPYNSRKNNLYGQQIRPSRHYDSDEDLVVKSTDLPATYEQEMIDIVQAAFRKYEITNQRELAGFLKRAADKTFSPCWHCIVGRQFSSYVTHEMNGFIYFTKGPLSILLFRSGA